MQSTWRLESKHRKQWSIQYSRQRASGSWEHTLRVGLESELSSLINPRSLVLAHFGTRPGTYLPPNHLPLRATPSRPHHRPWAERPGTPAPRWCPRPPGRTLAWGRRTSSALSRSYDMEAEEKEKGGGRGDVEENGGGGEYKLGGEEGRRTRIW